jgi:hypothetical protein
MWPRLPLSIAEDQPAQMKAALAERLLLHPSEIGRVGRFDGVVHAPFRTRACDRLLGVRVWPINEKDFRKNRLTPIT